MKAMIFVTVNIGSKHSLDFYRGTFSIYNRIIFLKDVAFNALNRMHCHNL